MKPILFRNLIAANESFHIQEDLLTNFYDLLHYHSELQLTLVIKSKGSAVIGDKIIPFEEGDLFLLGSGLPHVFRNEQPSNDSPGSLGVHTISVYFRRNSFGEHFFDLPENHRVNDLLQKSCRGIRFPAKETEKVKKHIASLQKKKETDLLITFLQILDVLSTCKSVELLSSLSFMNAKTDSESKRIQDIFTYVMNNFSREISLEEISDVSKMSVTSFCRFFKQRTRKTFTTFVNEVRIGHACKELLYNNYNINEVAYRCGFNNISNFNRQFKLVTGQTPSEYSKKGTRNP